MKDISEYIEGVPINGVVPSIKGIIIKITPPTDQKETQIIKIKSQQKAGESISLHIKDKALYVVHPKVGNILSITSTGKAKAAASGLLLKENKTNKIKYITVQQGAIITQESVTEKEEEEQEPMTAADTTIDNYVLDRLYVYKRTVAIIQQFSDINYPIDKAAELATSVHIELSRKSIAPRPTNQQLERKAIHKNKKTTLGKVIEQIQQQEKTGGWRDCKHPASGVRLGDEPIEKLGTLWGPWVLRQNRASLAPAFQEFYDNIVMACKEFNIGPQEMYDVYLVHYAYGAESDEKKRKLLIERFEKGLVKTGEVKKLPPTNAEAADILCNWKTLWKAIMIDED